MEIKVKVGSIKRIRADAIIMCVYENMKRPRGDLSIVNKALGGAISDLLHNGEIKGKLAEITVIHTLGKITADRVITVGLGKRNELTADKVRSAAAEICRALKNKGVKRAAIVALGTCSGMLNPREAGQAIAEGVILGSYAFRKHLTAKDEGEHIETILIVDRSRAVVTSVQQGVTEGTILAEATNLARDLVNEPGNYMTPTSLAAEAVKVAEKYKMPIQVYDREEIQKMGMGAFLGVAQGSDQPPKFVVMKYKGNENNDIDIALIGKGLTFDSGGISLKPAADMGDMKGDMAGAASVIAAMNAIAQLKPGVNVMAIIAATENMPGGRALKPADVLVAMNGKTIEVDNTDAEGRLTLADAVSYANKQGAKRIIDIATLTGGVVTALGDVTTGGFTNNQELLDAVIKAGNEEGDKIWQLPLFDEYKEQNKSDVADIKNSGGKAASPITAALFIAEFIGNTPWVHLDIAGTSDISKTRGYYTKGATGVPTRTLVKLVTSLGK
ncbi:MAG: leucyl aminopeptidase [Dehalococcoidales bacterium]|nr:leucyl aminopeptidase [Dehalococcoidales bacterium]